MYNIIFKKTIINMYIYIYIQQFDDKKATQHTNSV